MQLLEEVLEELFLLLFFTVCNKTCPRDTAHMSDTYGNKPNKPCVFLRGVIPVSGGMLCDLTFMSIRKKVTFELLSLPLK